MVFKRRKRKNKEVWHKWFAWYPVTIGDSIVWLQTVMRKGAYWEACDPFNCGDYGYDYEYKLKEGK